MLWGGGGGGLESFYTFHLIYSHEQTSLLNGVYRVNSGNFGHQINSDIRLQTVEIQMRRLLMSRLIRTFTVCLVNLCFHSSN